MTLSVRITAVTIVLLVLGCATVLATISGAIGALDWAARTFGSLAVYIAGAFLAGAVVTHAVHQGMAARAAEPRRPLGIGEQHREA